MTSFHFGRWEDDGMSSQTAHLSASCGSEWDVLPAGGQRLHVGVRTCKPAAGDVNMVLSSSSSSSSTHRFVSLTASCFPSSIHITWILILMEKKHGLVLVLNYSHVMPLYLKPIFNELISMNKYSCCFEAEPL